MESGELPEVAPTKASRLEKQRRVPFFEAEERE